MCKLHILESEEQEVIVETMKRANEAAERLAKTGGDSYRMLVDHIVGLQERNVLFAREMFEGTAREIRQQADSTRSLGEELSRRAEVQRDAFQRLVGESADAYKDFMYAPLAYYRQGLRLVEDQVDGGTGFPIAGYDEMNVREISGRLEGLSAAEIRKIRDYERRNKNRETLIEQFDRKLKAASA